MHSICDVRTSVRPKTYASYDLNVRRLAPHLGRLKLASLTAVDIQRAYAALLDQGLSRRSVVQAHTVIHNAREKMRDALGNRFDIRDFHDAVLKPGALPLPLVEQQVEEQTLRIAAN